MRHRQPSCRLLASEDLLHKACLSNTRHLSVILGSNGFVFALCISVCVRVCVRVTIEIKSAGLNFVLVI